jgi:D-sedoheptulose 7-phosphate isomerase
MINYTEELKKTVIPELEKQGPAIVEVAAFLKEAQKAKKQIFICGNGGSAAVASHFASDLQKLGYRVFALTDSNPTITMYGNDYNFNFIFAYQMAGRADPGDILIVISGSGCSKNIIQACHFAAATEMTTIAFTGLDGGMLKRYQQNLNIKYLIHIPTDMEHSEDSFAIIAHWIKWLVLEENPNEQQKEASPGGAPESTG